MKQAVPTRPQTDTTFVITKATEFFDPAQCEYYVHGFFEELLDAETNQFYGVRVLRNATRKMGSDGRVKLVLTANEWVVKGTRMVLIKASNKKPKTVWAMIQPLCGRKKNL